MSRSDERVHILQQGGEQEWLFVRNPIDSAHFSATHTLHHERELVDYSLMDLQLSEIATQWDSIACFGIAPADIAGLQPTAETRWAFGLEFRRFVQARDAGSERQVELWWNEEQALPLRLSTPLRNGALVLETTAIRLQADAQLLRDPALRFPDYASFDVSDWRESLHDH